MFILSYGDTSALQLHIQQTSLFNIDNTRALRSGHSRTWWLVYCFHLFVPFRLLFFSFFFYTRKSHRHVIGYEKTNYATERNRRNCLVHGCCYECICFDFLNDALIQRRPKSQIHSVIGRSLRFYEFLRFVNKTYNVYTYCSSSSNKSIKTTTITLSSVNWNWGLWWRHENKIIGKLFFFCLFI